MYNISCFSAFHWQAGFQDPSNQLAQYLISAASLPVGVLLRAGGNFTQEETHLLPCSQCKAINSIPQPPPSLSTTSEAGECSAEKLSQKAENLNSERRYFKPRFWRNEYCEYFVKVFGANDKLNAKWFMFPSPTKKFGWRKVDILFVLFSSVWKYDTPKKNGTTSRKEFFDSREARRFTCQNFWNLVSQFKRWWSVRFKLKNWRIHQGEEGTKNRKYLDTYGSAILLHRMREFVALGFASWEKAILTHVKVEAP